MDITNNNNGRDTYPEMVGAIIYYTERDYKLTEHLVIEALGFDNGYKVLDLATFKTSIVTPVQLPHPTRLYIDFWIYGQAFENEKRKSSREMSKIFNVLQMNESEETMLEMFAMWNSNYNIERYAKGNKYAIVARSDEFPFDMRLRVLAWSKDDGNRFGELRAAAKHSEIEGIKILSESDSIEVKSKGNVWLSQNPDSFNPNRIHRYVVKKVAVESLLDKTYYSDESLFTDYAKGQGSYAQALGTATEMKADFKEKLVTILK